MSCRKVSIIIPSFREEGLKRCLEAIKENSGVPEEQYEILIDTKKESPSGAINAVNRLVNRSTYDLVCFLSDDCIPQKDFLKKMLEEMKKLPDGWGLVGTNDTRDFKRREEIGLAAFWLADKRLLPFLNGEFFHSGYWHTFCDTELTIRCHSLGRYTYIEEQIIYHDHPLATAVGLNVRGALEGEYAKFYSTEWWVHDMTLFRKRKRKDWN